MDTVWYADVENQDPGRAMSPPSMQEGGDWGKGQTTSTVGGEIDFKKK